MRTSSGLGAAALSLLSFATPGSAFFRMPCPGHIVTERADPIVNPGGVSGHVHTISGGLFPRTCSSSTLADSHRQRI